MDLKSTALFMILVLIHLAISESKASRSSLLTELFNGYDASLPPNINSDYPVEVQIEIFVNNFDSINELSMDYSMNIFLRRTWTDSRLSFDPEIYNISEINLDPKKVNDVWVPDLFFSNEKSARFHSITTPNHLMRIDSNGTVFFSSRISVTADCPMHLEKFPLDTQVCALVIESYAYSTDTIIFHWTQQKELDKADTLTLPQFVLEDTSFHESMKSYKSGNSSRDFTQLVIEFVLRRDIQYYIVQTYVPSMLIVALSWVAFWISYDSVPARITLGLLTVLTLTTQTYAIRQTLPRVSYIKSIDVWMSTCLFFVFLALLEFAFVNVSHRKFTRMSTRRPNIPRKSKEDAEDGTPARRQGHEIRASTLDRISRVVFPVSFLIFNMIYWTVYSLWEDEGPAHK
ncbi:glycine receptor subunit alpha-2-like [Lingula anatina]|uniref:Gamma-aminobutyric acid receptor subunit beta n=1 Tax=Lingula anatina TaxID=7574 RepID=A0A1S3H668_LINAN|nr:glycine receptor subunit alpha-2-like [Lingula anatina]|eukprot:XP_013380619.1 glycine receptor subunit alpha-2-like [Lingula anatina]